MEDYQVYTKNVSKIFKDFWGKPKTYALQDVDLAIKKGTTVGLLGPNGAGKSTLMKLLLGHLHPSSGKIAVLNQSPRCIKAKSKIGYLPENSYFYKNLSALEILNYFGGLLNLDKQTLKKRTEQLLSMVGLTKVKNRPIGEYSHGMIRRIGIAQVLLNDPDLIILDEPTSGLDPIGCKEIKNLILNLKQRGKTILIASHILSDIEAICDEITILIAGRIQAQGAIDKILEVPLTQQINFAKTSEQTLQKLLSQMEKLGIRDISICSAQQSLENYFLNLIEQKAKKTNSTQTQISQGIAQYLKKEETSQAQTQEDKKKELQKQKTLEKLSEQKSDNKKEINKKILDDLTK